MNQQQSPISFLTPCPLTPFVKDCVHPSLQPGILSHIALRLDRLCLLALLCSGCYTLLVHTKNHTLLFACHRGLANAQSLCITLPGLSAPCLCLVHRCALPAPLASSTAWLSHPCGVHHCSFSMCTACTSYLLCNNYASFSCALPAHLFSYAFPMHTSRVHSLHNFVINSFAVP